MLISNLLILNKTLHLKKPPQVQELLQHLGLDLHLTLVDELQQNVQVLVHYVLEVQQRIEMMAVCGENVFEEVAA